MKLLKRITNMSILELQELQEAVLTEVQRRKAIVSGGLAVKSAPAILPMAGPNSRTRCQVRAGAWRGCRAACARGLKEHRDMTSDSITHNCAAIVFMAASLGLLFSRPDAIRADEVTYSISGTVSGAITDESTNHYVPTSIIDGSTFTGTISFDKSATGTIGGSSAQYRGTDLNLAVDILIAGQYEYVDTTPSNSDEIDLSSSGTPRFAILQARAGRIYRVQPVPALQSSRLFRWEHFDGYPQRYSTQRRWIQVGRRRHGGPQ